MMPLSPSEVKWVELLQKQMAVLRAERDRYAEALRQVAALTERRTFPMSIEINDLARSVLGTAIAPPDPGRS